jgi:DNA-binding GntR family transcriptional regulator
VPSDDRTWDSPPLSTTSAEAATCYRRGIAALVAGISHAEELLAEAVAIDPDFHLARIGVAAAQAAAGQPYVAPVPTRRPLRGERQHGEIVGAALAGDRRHAADLRREHLLEYPGDLLIVWLPALPSPPPR